MVLSIYYKIWVDGITKLRSRPENKGMWVFYAMVFTSMAMALNIGLIMSILQRNILKHSFYDIKISIFPLQQLNGFASFFVLYLLAPILINYILIFKNKRYEKLIIKYKSYNGKLYASYLLISYFLPFVLLLIAFLLKID
jgi:hypothetical protein